MAVPTKRSSLAHRQPRIAGASGSEEHAALTTSRAELLVDGSDAKFRQLVHDLLALSSRIQEIRNRFGEAVGLSGTGYTVLIAISFLKDERGVGINHVADHLHLSGAFVTIEVKRLVELGLVLKRPSSTDRRRVTLALTAKARRLLDKLTDIQVPTNDTLFSSLTRDDFFKLGQMISSLVASGDEAIAYLEYTTKTSVR